MYKVKGEKYISETEFDEAVKAEIKNLAKACVDTALITDDFGSAVLIGRIGWSGYGQRCVQTV